MEAGVGLAFLLAGIQSQMLQLFGVCPNANVAVLLFTLHF